MIKSTRIAWFIAFSAMLFSCRSGQASTTPLVATTERDLPVATTRLDKTLTSAPETTSNGLTLANYPLFLASNIWNARVDALPVHPQSGAWLR